MRLVMYRYLVLYRFTNVSLNTLITADGMPAFHRLGQKIHPQLAQKIVVKVRDAIAK